MDQRAMVIHHANTNREDSMLYNNDTQLWANYRETLKTYPNGGPCFTVSDAGDIGNGYEILARCANKPAAVRMLQSAGFRQYGSYWKA